MACPEHPGSCPNSTLDPRYDLRERDTDFFPYGASVPERVRSTTAAPHMRPQRRGWPRRDRGPPPERTQSACSRLAAVGGSRRRQHASLPYAQRAAASSAPLPTANTRPSTFLMAPAAAVMLAVPASMSASTLQAAMGVRDIRVRGRHPPRGPCAREGSVRTVAGGAKDRVWRRTTLSTCSRQPLQCKEAPFTATVKQAAQQQAPRQTWCAGSTGEHASLLRDQQLLAAI